MLKTIWEENRAEGVENFLTLLETRLDNVVYRLGFAKTRKAAKAKAANSSSEKIIFQHSRVQNG